MSESIKTFFEQVDQVAEAGERVAVATIARTRGSTPREAGAKMIIRSAGNALGTIGGGCGEAEVWRTALDVIADGKARMVHVDLTEEISLSSEGVCGGTLDVFVDPWGPEQRSLLRGGVLGPGHQAELALLPAIEQRVPVTLATVIERRRAPDVLVGGKLLVRADGSTVGTLGSPALEALVVPDAVKALQQEQPKTIAYTLGEGETPSAIDVLLEPFGPPPELVIIGAGHIALPLAKMAKLCDFDVTVIDDRPSFANEERFPDADRVIAEAFESAVQRIEVTPRTYLVLVTRAHTYDVYSLRHLIEKDAAYIGMIGAQRRVWAVLKLLHDEGISADLLEKVRAPIGIAGVDAETPAEIAASILCEMIAVRRGGKPVIMSDRLRERFQRRLRSGESIEEPDL
jgi:xanthine dehydrogenase accessory factor